MRIWHLPYGGTYATRLLFYVRRALSAVSLIVTMLRLSRTRQTIHIALLTWLAADRLIPVCKEHHLAVCADRAAFRGLRHFLHCLRTSWRMRMPTVCTLLPVQVGEYGIMNPITPSASGLTRKH